MRIQSLAAGAACVLFFWHTVRVNADSGRTMDETATSLKSTLGPDAESAWTVTSGSFIVSRDESLGKNVMTVDKTTNLILEGHVDQTDDREYRGLVRLRTEVLQNATVSFYVAKKDAQDPGLCLHLSATRSLEAINCSIEEKGKPLHDVKALTEKLDWESPVSNSFVYNLKAYTQILPGWPEDFRVRIENDMTALPNHDSKWLEVRIEVRKGQARFWLEDRLAAEKVSPEINPEGEIRIDLSPGVQLGTFKVARLIDTKGYVPVSLGGYANARELMDKASVKIDSLPPTRRVVRVGGIPFIFTGVNTEGNDHIDIGKSLFRQANSEDYNPSYGPAWAGSTLRDPARIQLRIPFRQYNNLYLIAASDDQPDHVPVIIAMFFRPSAGFAESFAARVPLATATSSDAKPLPVTLTNGRRANLWLMKIPLDPARLTAFSDLDVFEVELTKKVYQYRSYPDPYLYGWHQGGLPSAVHVYAMTLGEAPVGFTLSPDKFGHVWTAPEVPSYTVTLSNNTNVAQTGRLTITTRSYDGSEETKQEKRVSLAKGQELKIGFPVRVNLNGYHELFATLKIAGRKWTEQRSFVRLAPDTRAERWTEGKGALFGYWSYHGGHYTPKSDHHINLMTAAGARSSISLVSPGNEMVKKHWARVPAGAWEVSPQPWAKEEPYDPQKYEAYQKEVSDAYAKSREAVPEQYRPDHVYFFPEPHVSSRMTDGNYPTYWGEPDYRPTPEERERIRMFTVTAKFAAEAVRKKWPNLKILIAWGDPLFVVPLLKAGYPKELIDGSGLDNPGFERVPEQQLHQMSTHRYYELRKEFAKAGLSDPALYSCEGIFVPTEVGACTWREQMDFYNRWALLSMAYGVKRFYSGWFAFDCGDYYGAEHYGGCGIQRRIPYCDPKPAYAAYATMTDRLDQANFDGWLKTGSLSTYCLRFNGPKGNVYTLWTIRGKRPVTLTLASDNEVTVTDAMNNTKRLKCRNKQITISTDPSVIYVTGAGEVVSVEVGDPDHSDAAPTASAKLLADLGDGSWCYTSERDLIYENNNYDTARFPGRFSSSIATDPQHGKVLVSTLGKQDKVHELMPWYNVLTPRKPMVLPGAPAALGIWVKGASDWGRVIYCLRDAKGERWISIGSKDQYNCDDLHSWSAFNFDGWRYLRFELPGHLGYDSFRRHGTTWWRSVGGDGIVDLPLALESIIVEQRSHILYVNDVQSIASDTLSLGKLYVEYQNPDDASPEAVRISRLRMPPPQGLPDLPNPIARLEREGAGEPTIITGLEPPEHYADGTRIRVYFKEVPGAQSYFVWVSAYPDGRGAANVSPSGLKSGDMIYGLRPGTKFFFYATYQDARGQMSKPSKSHAEALVEAFKEK